MAMLFKPNGIIYHFNQNKNIGYLEHAL